jgi:hypothetical protein
MAIRQADDVTQRRGLRLETLVGRRVRTAANRVIGRLEEVRVELSSGHYVITEYVIGPAGLFERLGLSLRNLVGRKGSGYVARRDQLDITDPEHPRLTCALGDLKQADGYREDGTACQGIP